MPEQDFMPIQNFDYLEFYVGNAKHTAYYLSNAWGFTPIAYAGLETGIRNRSSYVLEQGNIRLVVTSFPSTNQPRGGANPRSKSISTSIAAQEYSISPSTPKTSFQQYKLCSIGVSTS